MNFSFTTLSQLFSGDFPKRKLPWLGFLTVESGLAAVHFSREVRRIVRSSGLLFTSLYLKQCGVSLQRYYAGCWDKTDKQAVPVSLTRCGLPRIIPSYIRMVIRKRDDRADIWVKIILSWCRLCGIIELAARVKSTLFESIVTPTPDMDSLQEVLSNIKTSYSKLQPIYLPHLTTHPLELGMTWEPTWKSVPLMDSFIRRFDVPNKDPKGDEREKQLSKCHNIFSVLKHEIAAFSCFIKKLHSIPDGYFSSGILWNHWTYYPHDPNNTKFANHNLDYFERCVGPFWADLPAMYQSYGIPLATGRLSCVTEGSGKRRIFAICNYIKQRLLAPVHTWSMKILSPIPMAGILKSQSIRAVKREKMLLLDGQDRLAGKMELSI